jgi:hypothetical protein
MFLGHDSVDVFIGIDVGKTAHHAVAIDRAGKKLLDRTLPQDDAKLCALIQKAPTMARSWWSSTSPSRTARFRWPSLRTWVCWSDTSLAWP